MTLEAQTSDAPAGTGVAGGYRGVGASLRARRVELGLDLGEVADRLRIRRTYLAAIEDGRVDDLPGPIYAVGFVRTYADFLGFQPVPAVERFKAELARALQPTRLSFPTPSPESRAPRGWAIVIGLVLAGGVFALWQFRQQLEMPDLGIPIPPPAEQTAAPPPAPGEAPRAASAPPAAVPAPPVAAAPAPATTPPPSSSPIAPAAPSRAVDVATLPPMPGGIPAPPPATPSPAPPDIPAQSAAPPAAAQPAAAEGANVVLRATADSWVTISGANNEVIVPGRILRPGDTLRIANRPDAILWTGNLGGLEVSIDDKPIPRLGQSGESRRNVSLDPQRLLAGTAVTR